MVPSSVISVSGYLMHGGPMGGMSTFCSSPFRSCISSVLLCCGCIMSVLARETEDSLRNPLVPLPIPQERLSKSYSLADASV